MFQFWRVFVTVLTATSFHIQASEHQNAVQATPTGIRITPFQLEIRAPKSSLLQEQASIDLKSFTEDHITQYIKKQNDAIWDQFSIVSLYAEEEDIDSIRKLRRLLRNNNNDSKRQQQELIVRFKVMYSGSMIFLGSNLTLPTREESEKIILDAFIGQGKLDFLSLVQSSSDEFLSTATYAKVWISSDEVNEVVEKKGNNQMFLISSIIAFALTVMGALYYLYCCCKESRGRTHKALHDNDEELSDNKRRSRKQKKSLSPTCIKPIATRSLSPPPPSSPQKGSGGRTYDGSVASKATIDVNGSVDMIAWKNKNANSNIPFETDITMITNASPNKTIQVEIPSEIGGRSKTSRSLSRGILNQHNGRHYDNRSRRTKK